MRFIVTALIVILSIARRLTCDDLVKNKCEVDVLKGSMEIRGFKIKYRQISPVGVEIKRDPLILLHGGPGSSHLYLDPMKYLACDGRRVIMYDQLGVGASDWPDMDENPFIKTVDYYLEEVRAILSHLNVSGGYHIYGHSWGGIIAQEYAIRYGSSLHERDENLRSVTLASIFIREEGFIEGLRRYLLPTLPPFTRELIEKSWLSNDYSSEWLEEASLLLDFQFGTRTVPVPTCVLATERQGTFNTKLYVEMQGPNEFSNGGVLAGWNRSEEIRKVVIPIAATTGEYDTMTRTVVNDLRKFLPSGSPIKTFTAAGHASMIDQPDLTNEFQGRFIRGAEDEYYRVRS